MSEQEAKTATIDEIFAVAEAPQVRKVLADIFTDLHPRLSEQKSNLESIFTAESAAEFLQRITELETVLSESDEYEQTLGKFQAQIDAAESVRDQVLAQVFEQIRPLEASYRQLWLFFENSVVPDGKQRKPVEFHAFNADPKTMKDRESVTLEAIRRFIASRNDNFNFRDDVCNIVVPGSMTMEIREALEEEALEVGQPSGHGSGRRTVLQRSRESVPSGRSLRVSEAARQQGGLGRGHGRDSQAARCSLV